MDLLFAHYPNGSMRFFRKVLLFGFASGLCMFLPLLFFLHEARDSPHWVDHLLRWYHLARLVTFTCQTPLRLLMWNKIKQAANQTDREAVVRDLLAMTRSDYWRLNQLTGLLAYTFFIFAVLFSYFGRSCASTSPMLYRFLLVQMVVFLLHMSCSCLWLKQIMVEDAFEAAMWKRGVHRSQIDKLTKVFVFPDLGETEGEQQEVEKETEPQSSPPPLFVEGYRLESRDCSICYCPYTHPQPIRVLPCQHPFHAVCIDSWLERKKQCPMCLAAIDQPVEESAFTRRKLSERLFKELPQQPEQGNHDIVVGAAFTHMPAQMEQPRRAEEPPVEEQAEETEQREGVRNRTDSSESTSSSSSEASSVVAAAPSSSAASSLDFQSHAPVAASSSSSQSPAAAPSISSISTSSSPSSPASTSSPAPSSTSELASGPADSSSSSPSSSSSHVKQVQRSSQPAVALPSSSKPAPTLPASRLPYASSRLSAAQEAWRAELEEWAEEKEEGGEEQEASPATGAASSSALSAAALDRMMEQWRLEEQQQQREAEARSEEEE